ncbi:MAG: glycosyltransferase [Clostridiales bacterium]|jgi:glycosyltransferase involved in cell wall biosynthesis/spore maturation protein CgeB|nr:glycosyltransferase [Clostridiales bacterium]
MTKMSILNEADNSVLYKTLISLADSLPVSGGSRFYKPYEKKIGIISDDFLLNALKDTARFIHVTPENADEAINGVEFLLITTAWRDWLYMSNVASANGARLVKLLDRCKEKQIPLVFYSIEDPTHYSEYLYIAKKCDYVFTSSAETAARYENDCGHKNVYVLRFFCNPLYHNPIGSRRCKLKDNVVFAGTWYNHYEERCRDAEMIFGGIMESGRSLDIINRCSYLSNELYAYPEKYKNSMMKLMPHKALQGVHKLYNWAVNLNTVKDSLTMFAMRTYELEATGNLMLSNYSAGVFNRLPLIQLVHQRTEVAHMLNSLSDEEIYERQTAGVRHAMKEDTCFDRMREMLEKIIPAEAAERENPRTAVVAETITPRIERMFKDQTYQNRELISAESLRERYADFDVIAFFHPNMTYEGFYLEDMINGFKYTDRDYISKDAYYSGDALIHGIEHDYVERVGSKYRAVFWAKSAKPDALLALKDGAAYPNGYGIDHFNYNARETTSAFDSGHPYKLSVIVAVYNNGLFLYGKAFPSLRRSGMFEDMEIILVDDGSTDNETPAYIQAIANRYKNVRTFAFTGKASGSASRPRNKGVEMASTEYITFLDPDNEAINDAYTALYKEVSEKKLDIALGNVLQAGNSITFSRNYQMCLQANAGVPIITAKDKTEFLSGIKFMPISIQAMVIKKDVILSNGLIEVEGAVGEDSLFSYELLKCADNIAVLDICVHVYYTCREGSVVNAINPGYFRKQLILEESQFQYLKRANLLKDFMKVRFNHFFEYWLLKKLEMAKPKDAAECNEILKEMLKIYLPYYNGQNEKINRIIINDPKLQYSYLTSSVNPG